MADHTENGIDKSFYAEPEHAKSQPATIEVPYNKVKDVAARLYGQGYKRSEVARLLVDHLVTDEMRKRPQEQKMAAARSKLKRWETMDSFRDLIWKQALIKVDLQTPAILEGVTKKAKKGRVDAARLLLEVTGRHNPKGDSPPAQIAVVVNGVPRPRRATGRMPNESVVIEEDGTIVQAVEAIEE